MNKFKLLFAAACLCLAWFNPAVAEEKSEGVGVLIKITAKDGHDKALIQGITDYHKWVANFDGHMRFNWWKAVTGPDTGVYYAYSGNHDWADFDADYDWEEKSNEVLEAYIRQLIEAHRTPQVTVAWQGGEPTLMGLDFFARSVELVEQYRRAPGGAVRHWWITQVLVGVLALPVAASAPS